MTATAQAPIWHNDDTARGSGLPDEIRLILNGRTAARKSAAMTFESTVKNTNLPHPAFQSAPSPEKTPNIAERITRITLTASAAAKAARFVFPFTAVHRAGGYRHPSLTSS